ncbi:hypothetical protein T03_9803 [Trichinella britovi]|uniref:Uncharacterized protein n=1 Tax=Trichinella britovi TaxID=45882 RepID=A0A0V0YPU6_TRIBR|nr:hypothetical protein T03_9803 [Trichinella britovi]
MSVATTVFSIGYSCYFILVFSHNVIQTLLYGK